MLTERKLTEREVESREVVLKGLLKNKRNLVKKYGKDAEQVMYGIATKKAKTKVESMNKEKIKELIYKTLTREDNDPSGADLEGDPNEYVVGEGHGLDKGDVDFLQSFVDRLGVGKEPVDAKEFTKLKNILQFIIKSNILQDKTKDLSVKEENMSSDDKEGEIIKIIKMMNPQAKEEFLKKLAKMGKGKVDENASQDDAAYELRNIVDQIEQLSDDAKETVRNYFPNELSRLEAYGVFDMIYSSNRYDVSLGRFVDRVEEGDFDDLDDEDYVNEKMLPLIKKSLAKAPKADKVAKKKKMKLPSGMVNYMDFTKSVAEKLTKKHKVGDYVDDFQKSDAKQFKGKSDKKKKQMAVAAYLSKQND